MSCGMLLRPIPDGNKHWNSHWAPVLKPPSALRLGKPVVTHISLLLHLMPSYNVSFMSPFYVCYVTHRYSAFHFTVALLHLTFSSFSICELHFFCNSGPTRCLFFNCWVGWEVTVSNRFWRCHEVSGLVWSRCQHSYYTWYKCSLLIVRCWPLVHCYLYAVGSGLQYNKCPYYEICTHKFNIKYDKKLQFSPRCLFSVRQRMAYILLCEPPALYSPAYSQVLLLHSWDSICHYNWKERIQPETREPNHTLSSHPT